MMYFRAVLILVFSVAQFGCAVYGYNGVFYPSPAEPYRLQAKSQFEVIQQIVPLENSLPDDLSVTLPTDQEVARLYPGEFGDRKVYLVEVTKAGYQGMVKVIRKTNLFRGIHEPAIAAARYELRVELQPKQTRYGNRDVYKLIDRKTGREEVLDVIPGTFDLFSASLLEEMMRVLRDWKATERKHEFLPPRPRPEIARPVAV